MRPHTGVVAVWLAVPIVACASGPDSVDPADCPPLVATDDEPNPTHTPACEDYHAGPDLAAAVPDNVRAGESFTIVPNAAIEPICGDVALALRFNTDAYDRIATLSPSGVWHVFGDQPGPTIAACSPETTSEPMTYVVPPEMTAGDWRICRTDTDGGLGGFLPDETAAGCADVTVEPVEPVTSATL